MELVLGISEFSPSRGLERALRMERATFAAKLRAVRALLGLSQDEFAHAIGLTQKTVHRIEQNVVQPKLRTVLAIERFWCDRGISFESVRDGGFRLTVAPAVLLGD